MDTKDPTPWQLRGVELTDKEVEALLENARTGKGCLPDGYKPKRIKTREARDDSVAKEG